MRYYLNGALFDPGGASAPTGLRPDDRGLTVGDGVFETIAVHAGEPRRLDAHLQRILAGLETLAFARRPGRGELIRAVEAVIAGNALNDGVVRLCVTRGSALRGLSPQGVGDPTVLASASERLPPATPIDAIVATRVRRNELSPTSRIKCLSYLDNVLARMEAEERGAHEALLLNTRGRLAEAATANVFLVQDGRLATPPVEEGALPGIARAAIVDAVPVVETAIDIDQLEAADEILLTNALGVRALRSLDGRTLDAASAESLAGRLRRFL